MHVRRATPAAATGRPPGDERPNWPVLAVAGSSRGRRGATTSRRRLTRWRASGLLRAVTGSNDRDSRGPSTLAVHGGEPYVRPGRSLTVPAVHASTYPFDNTQELVDFMEGRLERPHEYGRYGNPTVEQAEAKLAALEGAESAVLMSSGMAAITTTLLGMLRPGQHIVLTADVYRRTRQFAGQVLQRYGVDVSIVEPNIEAIASAVNDQTRIIFSEAPTNPYLRVPDIAALVDLARSRRIKTIIDATLATPINMRPLDLGIDVVMHSATKYLGGHNDLLGGVVLGKRPVVEAVREQVGMFGPVLDAHSAFLLVRGLKTLALRVVRQNETALRLAARLEAHPQVKQVWYPMLASHPDHESAQRYLRAGGGLLSFEIHGGLSAGTGVIDGVRLFKIAPSFGGVESLIEQPPLMSFFELAPEDRARIGIREGLIRVSVGIEDADDLEADLVTALDRAAARV
ncbi:MAG: aminotransferase class I/II-fold pyridoxal phosphate-dependent enzyme [Myxococcales bacterium FL481]|nr:MAG: aminotransferase class I/II-fold pyridoxal phosphate-dependent enzyme [Myxococcales bacterium FL481]